MDRLNQLIEVLQRTNQSPSDDDLEELDDDDSSCCSSTDEKSLSDCRFSTFGCSMQFASAVERQQHCSEEVQYHLNLVLARCQELELQNTALRMQQHLSSPNNAAADSGAVAAVTAAALCPSESKPKRGRKRSVEDAEHSFKYLQVATETDQRGAAKVQKRSRKSKTSPTDPCPNPKKPKTAYNYFQTSIRKQIQFEVGVSDPNSTREERSQKVARIIGERWKALSEADRHPFQIYAEQDKKRYRQELESKVASQLSKQRQDQLRQLITLEPEAQKFVDANSNPANWTCAEVGQFMNALHLPHLEKCISENQISGRLFLQLQEQDLKDLEVKALGERKTVMNSIKQLQQVVEESIIIISTETKHSPPTSPSTSLPNSRPASPQHAHPVPAKVVNIKSDFTAAAMPARTCQPVNTPPPTAPRMITS
mmetsp:Transcript_42808/g.83906  ORF Transcript_42808/g.83906 Transcript_42808/m.83906 type:complete len:425 (-) Transcript_42808:126-1400(-)